MIRIIALSHGNLSAALVETAGMIMSLPPDLHVVGLQSGEGSEQLEAALRDLLPAGMPALILVDLLGGSPARVAAELAATDPGLQVVAGLNLAMLIEAASAIGDDVAATAALVQRAGVESVVNVGERLRAARDGD